MRVLTVNAGSSSLKLSVLDGPRPVASSSLESLGEGSTADAISALTASAGPIDAVGHRVVHGGTDFTGAVLIDSVVRRRLEELSSLAPLHQPASLAAMDAAATVLPHTPAVACFDTAFHSSLPPAAATYALPADWRRRWPLRRYGFHGLSHAYVSRRAPELLGRSPEELSIVSCHLGAGASLAAIQGGRCVDTTMGFTPLDGLVMATRSGSVDPGLLLWLEAQAGMSPDEVGEALEHRSGLVGLAGTADMREVLRRSEVGDPEAALALDVYLHRLISAIASMAGSMAGMDVLVFTGGVGEHSPEVRSRTAQRLGFLGIGIDRALNAAAGGGGDQDISSSDHPGRTLVITAREDLQIAREVSGVIGPE